MEKLNINVDLEIQPDPKFSGKGLTSIFLLNCVGPFSALFVPLLTYYVFKFILWKYDAKFE